MEEIQVYPITGSRPSTKKKKTTRKQKQTNKKKTKSKKKKAKKQINKQTKKNNNNKPKTKHNQKKPSQNPIDGFLSKKYQSAGKMAVLFFCALKPDMWICKMLFLLYMYML